VGARSILPRVRIFSARRQRKVRDISPRRGCLGLDVFTLAIHYQAARFVLFAADIAKGPYRCEWKRIRNYGDASDAMVGQKARV